MIIVAAINFLLYGSRNGSKYFGIFLIITVVIAFFFEKNPRIKDDNKKDQ